MSRAFVEGAENKAADSPDRSLSPHRNLVTKEGLAAIEVALGRFAPRRHDRHSSQGRRPEANLPDRWRR
jgi:hypothetical protein